MVVGEGRGRRPSLDEVSRRCVQGFRLVAYIIIICGGVTIVLVGVLFLVILYLLFYYFN